MNEPARAIQLNQVLLWAVPLIAIAFFALNKPATTSFGIREVSVPEAKTLIDSGALVLDVRGEEAYHARHLPGALSIPLAQLKAGIPASLADAKDKSIVVYCGDGATIGPEGTRILNNAGYKGAVNIRAGIEGWQKAGHPVRP